MQEKRCGGGEVWRGGAEVSRCRSMGVEKVEAASFLLRAVRGWPMAWVGEGGGRKEWGSKEGEKSIEAKITSLGVLTSELNQTTQLPPLTVLISRQKDSYIVTVELIHCNS